MCLFWNWRKFCVNLGKITKWLISLAISILVTSKVLVSRKGFIFTHFVYNRNFRQIWIKTMEWSIRVENCHFRTRFTSVRSILYIKKTWHILVKFIVNKVSLLSSRSNKKLFQLVDLVIGRLWYSYFGL